MPAPAEKNVVRFLSDVDPASGTACESCGSPRQTASFCRACAFQLIDVALSSSPGQLTVHDGLATDAPEPAPETARLQYDYYEICQFPDGSPWELGRGAMGITYKATDTHLNCPVALKIINARRLGGPKARDRFLREARIAARLRHPNIASVFHLGLGEEDCFYAMEYIEGETLEALLRREGRLPWQTALNIVAQSAKALRSAHAQQFIHRDIKPTNIMLVGGQHHTGEEVSVKLIDFGLVKTVAEKIDEEMVGDAYFAGTPHYASPEQLQSEAVDARSDIYSLGMCLGYMLTGAPPQVEPSENNEFFGSHSWSVSSDSCLADIPEPVTALLKRMVSRPPEARPETADVLLAEIAHLVSEVGRQGSGNTVTPSPTQKTRTGIQKWLPTFIALIGAVAFTTGIVAFCLSPRGRVEKERPTGEETTSVEARVLHGQATEHYRKYTKADNHQAIDLYQKAIAISPAYTDAYIKLAAAYFDDVCRYGAPVSELDLATAAALHAIAINPKASGAFQVVGAVRGFQGRPWDALTELRHALELDPKDASAICDFSLLWICVGEPQFALPWAKAAAQLQPSKTCGWHAAAEASVELCDDVAAEEFYRRCAEIEPTWMSPYCGLMHIHLLEGNFSAARQDFAKAESIHEGSLLALTLEAQIALFSGDYPAAEVCYRRLLTLDRNGAVRYYSGISHLSALGFLRIRSGDADEGNTLLAEAEKLHATGTEGPENIYDLAAIRAIQNRKQDALMLLDQAIQSGWNDYRASRLDPRFTALREEPRFQRLLDELSTHVAQMRTEAATLSSKPPELADYPIRPSEKTRGE